jgi:hypoxanthine phosphoribosyltransferase
LLSWKICLFYVAHFSVPRSFLKRPGSANIPIQAIGLSLYEDLGKDGPGQGMGTKITRTQWLDLSSLEMANLIGKNVLIVDEVDDTRTTLEYAVQELEKDVQEAQQRLGREGEKTTFSVFVLHVSLACPLSPVHSKLRLAIFYPCCSVVHLFPVLCLSLHLA